MGGGRVGERRVMGSDCWWVWGFFLGDENVLKLDYGDGCTTPWMNCTLYMMNWIIYELNLNKAVKKKKRHII